MLFLYSISPSSLGKHILFHGEEVGKRFRERAKPLVEQTRDLWQSIQRIEDPVTRTLKELAYMQLFRPMWLDSVNEQYYIDYPHRRPDPEAENRKLQEKLAQKPQVLLQAAYDMVRGQTGQQMMPPNSASVWMGSGTYAAPSAPSGTNTATLPTSLRPDKNGFSETKETDKYLEPDKLNQSTTLEIKYSKAKQPIENPKRAGIVKVENTEVRKWYLNAVSHIPDTINQSLPMAEKAKKAFETRNMIRTEARNMMADEAARKVLDQERPNKTFEELIKSKMERKGLTREEAIEDIYKTATKTNSDVNKELGLEE